MGEREVTRSAIVMLSPEELREVRARLYAKEDAEEAARVAAEEQAARELAASKEEAERLENRGRQLIRRGFFVDRKRDIPVNVFTKLIMKPALGCGVNGLLAKLKGMERWIVTAEGTETDVGKFREYLLVGQHAFGKTRVQVQPKRLDRASLEGFHLLPKEIVIATSDEDDGDDDDSDHGAVENPPRKKAARKLY